MLNNMRVFKDDLFTVGAILAVVFALSTMLIFATFFVTKIRGAMEEADEEYDLLKLGLLKHKEGCWEIDLGDLFDEYAAIKVEFGWIFRILFEGWEINGLTAGSRQGHVRGIIGRNTILLRRKIRRK